MPWRGPATGGALGIPGVMTPSARRQDARLAREGESFFPALALQRQQIFHHVHTRMVNYHGAELRHARGRPSGKVCGRGTRGLAGWAKWLHSVKSRLVRKFPGTRKPSKCPAPFGSPPRLGAALEGVLALVTVAVDPSMLSPIDTPRLNLRSA